MSELVQENPETTHAAESGPVLQALLADVAVARQKLDALAQAIPAERYGWRPCEGVRTVGEVVRHVAANNYFLPTMAGALAPAATGIESGRFESVRTYEARTLSKEESIAELSASFEHLQRIMRGLDAARLHEPLSVFGQSMPGLNLWVLTTTHLHENLGQLIAYARCNSVVPPWSN